MGFPITLSGCELGPLRLMMRPKMRPVTPCNAGVLTHSLLLGGTGPSESALAGTAVAPALSPCQPLLRPMSRCARRSLEMVMRPPRFGTSCHMRPLVFDMSFGFTMKKLATYVALLGGWSATAA